MGKHISAGIIINIEIQRDKNNFTYENDEAFISDKDKILELLGNDININLFNIEISDNVISLILKDEILNQDIRKLNNSFNEHQLFDFDSQLDNLLEDKLVELTIKYNLLNNDIKDYNIVVITADSVYTKEITPSKNITFKEIFNEYIFDEIDLDCNSKYYPLCFNTKAVELWKSKNTVDIDSIDDTLTLLDSYSRVFMKDIKLSNLLIYGVEV